MKVTIVDKDGTIFTCEGTFGAVDGWLQPWLDKNHNLTPMGVRLDHATATMPKPPKENKRRGRR